MYTFILHRISFERKKRGSNQVFRKIQRYLLLN